MLGWPIEPDGLTEMLERVHREYGPARLYVTENGAAFHDPPPVDGAIHDDARIAYLDAHVEAMRAAIDAGVPLAGYLVVVAPGQLRVGGGLRARFGLVHVDFETQERTPQGQRSMVRRPDPRERRSRPAG